MSRKLRQDVHTAQVVETWSQWAASGLLAHASFRQKAMQALRRLAEALHRLNHKDRSLVRLFSHGVSDVWEHGSHWQKQFMHQSIRFCIRSNLQCTCDAKLNVFVVQTDSVSHLLSYFSLKFLVTVLHGHVA